MLLEKYPNQRSSSLWHNHFSKNPSSIIPLLKCLPKVFQCAIQTCMLQKTLVLGKFILSQRGIGHIDDSVKLIEKIRESKSISVIFLYRTDTRTMLATWKPLLFLYRKSHAWTGYAALKCITTKPCCRFINYPPRVVRYDERIHLPQPSGSVRVL
jgi:DNA polymerase-3 subunit alpha/error-prone DNA polymerase